MPYTTCVCARTKSRSQAGSVYTRLCIFTALLFTFFFIAFPSIARATTLTASWSPNPEPNIAGYRLLVGTASGSYTTVIDVGKVTSYSFSVNAGATYYCVLQAYNTAGASSPYSAEVVVSVPGQTGGGASGGGSSGSSGGGGGGAASGGSGGSSSGGWSPFSGTPVSVPGAIEAAGFDNGGEGIAYHDSTPGNAGGQYRQTDVDLEVASDGGYDVGWTTPGEWLGYAINVASAGNYTVQLRVASPGGGLLHLGFNTAIGSTSMYVYQAVSIPATGGWQSWQTVSVPVTLAAGAQQMFVYFDTGGTNLRYALVWSSGAVSGGGGLPAGWQSQDVGSVGAAGSTSCCLNGSVITISGAGADIWGTADAFQFAYRSQTGDDYVMARVTSIQNTNQLAKAGVMIRSSTYAGAASVIVDVKPDGGIEFMARSWQDGPTTYYGGMRVAGPAWLLLMRKGSTFYAYAAQDGNQWSLLGTVNIDLPATVLRGLAVTSHSPQQLNTATFDGVH